MPAARLTTLAASALFGATLMGCGDPAPVTPPSPSRLSLLFTGHVIGEIEPCG
ncbi:MAG: hypothetical protein IPI35_19315 [Deltaproteobacteria bacterium]|nr:hypothetical protein [Deltaproteobacteria bacterium]